MFGPESSESSEMGLYGAAGAGGEESNDSLLEKRPHGVMIGRAVWSDPLMLSQADTMLGAKRNVNISRRELLEQYVMHYRREIINGHTNTLFHYSTIPLNSNTNNNLLSVFTIISFL